MEIRKNARRRETRASDKLLTGLFLFAYAEKIANSTKK